ncbi:MAG: UDP-N-acetylmuramoyl-L-alanyl-D-glutamate--2,6-diaminopimelate ligase [Tissierellia bacterium]|nr:UDP-N-acetylmuramoyl-L-alanyl-D-glutamate--2,6-diaminopimelate ligase [Tissierellia bacterium]
MKTDLLLSRIKVKTCYGNFPEEVSNITLDSREAREGWVFVARVGFNVDSHKFIPGALAQGCRFVVADRYLELPQDVGLLVVQDTPRVASLMAQYIYDFPSTKMNVVGVTGTSGKTSTATMIHSLLGLLEEKSAIIGTNGFCVGEEQVLNINTTPETTLLTRQFAQASKQKARHMVMEVSSHALSLGRTAGIDYDITIFTNLSHEHLDFYRDIYHYGYTKGMLLSQMGSDLSREKYVILNGDDPFLKEMRMETGYEILEFSLKDPRAEFFAGDIEEGPQGTLFTLKCPEGEFKLNSPYLGKINVENLLCALMSLWLKGFAMEAIVEQIPSLPPIEGRLQFIGKEELPITLLVDYALTPDGLERLLDAVKPLVTKRLILLTAMWGMGRDITKAPKMGRISSAADYVVFTNNHPGDDDRQRLVDELEKGITHKNYKKFLERRDAIEHAIEVSEPGDVVLLSGRGSEPFITVEGMKRVPFRDDLIALEFARKKYNRR